ncbi:MAG: SDR family oxidoreductase [Microbacterium sp.]|uniref:SDR family oxidoreductase n=1 Tax=Microbacterium sp. TaxID=51671 RepID=UPI002602D818|nr:SDR family oxidoreductase [Microbacterium sp.]MCX6503176.1 SDR family oxidoreductase [Microbacterium sp.]
MKIAVAGGTGLLGRRVVEEARRRDHEVLVLSRSEGFDLTVGGAATRALEGTDVVVDVLSVVTLKAATSIAFFEQTTRILLAVERDAGVPHHLALSIVGIDKAPFDYYAGKLAQERLVEASTNGWTILRATQFHEFAAQMYERARFGPLHLAPRMRTQPVAAAEVATRLVDLCERTPQGRVRDLAGPREESLVDMIRDYAEASGAHGWIPAVSLPGDLGRAQRGGLLLPDADADLGRTTFAEWLTER